MSNPSQQYSPCPADDRVVSLGEAAHLAGISIDTLRRLHARKEIKIIKLSPRRVGMRLSDLRMFIESRAA
jgi:hypothetical protein